MDPLKHLGKITLLMSIFLNIFLFSLFLKKISVDECFSAIQEYKKLFENERKNLKECEEREILQKTNKITPKYVPTTASLPKYEEELEKRHNVVPCESLKNSSEILQDDGFLRDCISGEIIGKVDLSLSGMVDIDSSGNAIKNNGGRIEEEKEKRQKSFEEVYESGAWGKNWDSSFKGMAVSGEGSTLYWAQEVSAVLHTLINAIKKTKPAGYKVRLLDAPCGDMAWMSRFLETRSDVEYTGIDIVPQIIKQHLEKFKSQPWKFYLKDVVQAEKIASYDIIHSRMMLQHLYDADVLKILKLFSKSNSSYLMTTTFLQNYPNVELIVTKENPGRFRPVNLEIPPFSLSHPLCYVHDGPFARRHSVAVWKLPLAVVKDCKPYFSKRSFYSCSETKFLKEL